MPGYGSHVPPPDPSPADKAAAAELAEYVKARGAGAPEMKGWPAPDVIHQVPSVTDAPAAGAPRAAAPVKAQDGAQ